MKIIHLPLIALGLGILLMAFSFLWPRMIGGVVWSEQQASKHAETAAELHRLSHAHSHSADHGEGSEREHKARSLEEAKQRYEQSKAMLERARAYRRRTARLLKWAGAACSLLGGAGYLFLRAAAG